VHNICPTKSHYMFRKVHIVAEIVITIFEVLDVNFDLDNAACNVRNILAFCTCETRMKMVGDHRSLIISTHLSFCDRSEAKMLFPIKFAFVQNQHHRAVQWS